MRVRESIVISFPKHAGVPRLHFPNELGEDSYPPERARPFLRSRHPRAHRAQASAPRLEWSANRHSHRDRRQGDPNRPDGRYRHATRSRPHSGEVHQAGTEEVQAAVAGAREAWHDWSRRSLTERAAVFLKAADLLATRWRAMVNAATMLGQSKTAFQAEIDAACELIDFWRFNVHYADRIHAEQPVSSAGIWNAMDYRGLEGFVYAITPFNFTSI